MTAEKLVLIDLSSIARPIYETQIDPQRTSVEIVAKVRALASAHQHVAIACDSRTSFRRDIDPTYKAQRPETPAVYLHELALAVEILRGDGFPVWQAEGFEADDIIATAWAQPVMKNMMIVSADKDLLQLVNERVEQFRPANGPTVAKTYDEAAVVERFGIQPHQMLDYLTLIGDTSDNVKGAEGIGPKKAVSMLLKFGNLDDIMAAVESGSDKFTPSTLKSLQEFKPRMELVRSLLRLRTDAPIPFEEILKPRAPVEDVVTFSGELPMDDDIEAAMPTLNMEQTMKLRNASESVGWMNSDGPLTVSPTAVEPFPQAQATVVEFASPPQSHASIAEALARAQGQLQHAEKDSNNPFFNAKYADLASVWTACRKPLSDNGIAVVQCPETIFLGTPVFEVKQTNRGERIIVKVITKVRVITSLLHCSGERIDNTIETLLPNGDPQSIGSAITYLRRYALASLVGVAPEDDDGEAATRIQPSSDQKYQAKNPNWRPEARQ